MSRRIPREVNIRFVPDRRTGGTHNVLEVCGKEHGVRFVMAQDSDTAIERDKYKLRAGLLEAENAKLREAAKAVKNRLAQLNSIGDNNRARGYVPVILQGDINALAALLEGNNNES